MLDIVASYHRMQLQGKLMIKNLAWSVARYQGQLSSSTISEKTIDPIVRKFSDRRDEQTDRQMDESDFITRCPTNVKHPTLM